MTSPTRAVAARSFRQLRTSSIVLGLSFGAVAASAASTYVDSFPTEATRAALVNSLRGDAGFSVLFGQVDAIGTVGGYTAYKCYVFLTTIGAVWAALLVTRLLRGEEEAGRWQLVLAGRTTPARATAATLAGVAAGIGVVFLGTAALTMLSGRSSDVGFSALDSVTFGLAVVLAPLCFAAVAAVCSQLAQTRRLATTLTMGIFAVAFVIRMIGDAKPSSHWLLWVTPLGWAELVQPLTENRLLPFIPALVLTSACVLGAVALAARRDAGSGVLATSETAEVRRFGLRSPLGLATRLNAPVLAAWAVGLAAMSFVMGIVSKAAASAVAQSGSANSVLHKLGATGTGASQYLAVVFLLIGSVLALVPANQIGAARDEEASGRLVQGLSRPPSPRRWLAGRLGLAATAIVAMGLLAGVTTWAGARSQGLDVGFADATLAGVNVIPAALLALGIGALALVLAPRFAAATVYALVAGSLVVDLLGSLVSALHALTRVSLFHYVALAPAQSPSWTNVTVYLVLAALACAIAIVALERRDLALD